MHDHQVEDDLRKVLRAEGDAVTMTITTAELERRLSLRRRERLGRRASVLAAAVAVVAVGGLLVSAGGWLRAPSAGSGPSPVATASPLASEATLPCESIEPAALDAPPVLTFGATPGDAIGYLGIQGAYGLGDREVGDPQGWSVPGPGALDPIAAGPPTERLKVSASDPDACLIGLVAEARQVAPLQGGRIDPTVLTLDSIDTEPSRVIEFAQPPPGQWIVRVRVAFDTEGQGDAWAQAWIGVLVDDPPASSPPLPATLSEVPAPEGTVLVENASASVPGEPTGTSEVIGLAPVPPRGDYRIDVICLGPGPLRWSFGREGGLEGDFGIVAAGDQVCDGTLGSLTLELGVPPRDVPVFVEANPATAWHIVVSSAGEQPPFLPPSLRGWWNEEAGATLREAFGHCVSSSFGADQCGPNWKTAAAAPSIHIAVAGRNSVGFQLGEDWDIANARITAVAAGTTAPEYSVGFIDTMSREIRVPIELDPGDWIVQVSLNARRGDESFGAFYNFSLTIGSPEAVVLEADE